jgi:uncharacterized protein (TIGR00369 family)
VLDGRVPVALRSAAMTGLEMLQRMVAGEIPPPPVARLLGFALVEATKERVVFRLDVDERHANPMGTLHGGIVCDIADAAAGCAVATTLEEGETYTTVELSMNFLRPVWKTTLTATGRLVKRSRKLALSTVEVTDADGKLVAFGKSTCLVLSGDDAKGR